MSNFIDISYFVGGIDIPNTDTTNKNALGLAIKKYESEFLTRFLGKALYAYLLSVTDFITDPNNPTAAGMDGYLINGISFTGSNGNPNYTEGIRGGDLYATSGFKRSMIANYVYWQWMRQYSSQTVGVGVVKSKVENMMLVSPKDKMVTAWNEMVDLITVLHDYLIINKADFPDYIGHTYPPIPNPTWAQIECMQTNQSLFIKHNVM